MADLLQLPGGPGGFVELGRVRQGKLYRKQILRYGTFAHPNDPKEVLSITPELVDQMVANFNAGVCDTVAVPLATDGNAHTEDPSRNIGEVIGIEKTDTGADVLIDVRKPEHEDSLGRTMLGISAAFHRDYTDTRTGKKVGPTLLHACITNRPYITGLEDFEVVAASNTGESPVRLADTQPDRKSPEDDAMTLEEFLASLEKDGIKVDADGLKALASKGSKLVELEKLTPEQLADLRGEKKDEPSQEKELAGAILTALTATGFIKDDTEDPDQVKAAILKLTNTVGDQAAKIATLTQQNDEARKSAATVEVDGLVKAGRILPANRDAMLELALSNHDLFTRTLPDKALVDLSELGADPDPNADVKLTADAEKEIDRLVGMAAERANGRKHAASKA